VLVRLLVAALVATPVLAENPDTVLTKRVDRVLAAHPVIDGHNDLAWELREKYGPGQAQIDLAKDTGHLAKPLMTDLPRLHVGHVGAQFWSVWIPATFTGPQAVAMTLEQIDVVHRFVTRYPASLEMAATVADIRRIEKAGKTASLIGVEGGHQIDGSLAVLRQYYALGARYMTLTHTSNLSWADSATDNPKVGGLTPFGVEVVHEMNRIGMLVDLSHVAPSTMKAALAATKAPVIFSHSNSRSILDHPRNVPDDVLELVAKNGGVVMVNFVPGYISAAYRDWVAARAAEVARTNAPPYGGLFIGQPDRAAKALSDWETTHPRPVVTIAEVADHIERIGKVAGRAHVAIGGDLDGIDHNIKGLEGVDTYPALFVELARRGWSDAELAGLSGENLLRVLAAAEKVAYEMKDLAPVTTPMPPPPVAAG
jgi:membrane dipeptidase